ncbi:MAG TPA: FAD-dependent oxidoreductase, partial [Bacteroidia bacterium]
GIVYEAGNIDTRKFLDSSRNYFIKHHSYLEEKFSFDHLTVNPDKIAYRENTANTITFCEGHLIKDNSYFNYLPFKPAKGEVLTIFCEDLNTDFILNKGVFILPLGDNLYRVGATYNWDDTTDIPGEKGKQELLQKLSKLIPYKYEIINYEAGVRPSTIDRRPVIGSHPVYRNVNVFNGFGTKAVMLAPHFARKFVSYLKNKIPLDAEVDCNRFYTK